jgi:16S rRNA (cytidine1402-2'-O)-methyltransferase
VAEAERTGGDAPVGRLYVVATPIGNLGDLTPRAADTLRSVDAIASEDTRRTRKLLSHFEIHTPLTAYHEHNETRASQSIVRRILDGESVALVTDAGTPLVSDPGYRLVELAAVEGIEIVTVPGPCAAVAALAISGLPPQPFHFEGFLPRRSAARRTKLESMSDLAGTLVFYVSTHRVAKALDDMLAVLGDRRAVLARELTKIHEEVLRGRLSELSEVASKRTLKGEIVVLVEGA